MAAYQTPRKHHTKAQRERIVQDYRRSGLAQRQFVARAGIGLSTLQLWLRQAARHAPLESANFVEVPNLIGAPAARSTYRLHLAGGMELEIASGFKPEELSALLRVLHPV